MSMSVQPGDESSGGICDCCGNEIRCVWGYVHENKTPVAVYFVHWTRGSDKHIPNIDFLMGSWAEESAQDKVAISWIYKPQGEKSGSYSLIDSAERPVGTSAVCATALTRKQVVSNTALVSKCGEMFDAIWAGDKRVAEVQSLVIINDK